MKSRLAYGLVVAVIISSLLLVSCGNVGSAKSDDTISKDTPPENSSKVEENHPVSEDLGGDEKWKGFSKDAKVILSMIEDEGGVLAYCGTPQYGLNKYIIIDCNDMKVREVSDAKMTYRTQDLVFADNSGTIGFDAVSYYYYFPKDNIDSITGNLRGKGRTNKRIYMTKTSLSKAMRIAEESKKNAKDSDPKYSE